MNALDVIIIVLLVFLGLIVIRMHEVAWRNKERRERDHYHGR